MVHSDTIGALSYVVSNRGLAPVWRVETRTNSLSD